MKFKISAKIYPITKEITSSTLLMGGMAFVIPTNIPHAFQTGHDVTLDIVAFHPESD